MAIRLLDETIQAGWLQSCGVYACKAMADAWEEDSGSRLRENFKHFGHDLKKNEERIPNYLRKNCAHNATCEIRHTAASVLSQENVGR